MKKRVRIWIWISILLLAGLPGCSNKYKRTDKKRSEVQAEILAKGSVLQTDNGFEFFRTDSVEESDGSFRSLNKNYIAVHDLVDDFYVYLPDSYEVISDIRADASGITVTYAEGPDFLIREIEVPVCFPARTEGIVGMDFNSERHMEGSVEWGSGDIREICTEEAVLEEALSALPCKVWQEEVFLNDKTCEVTFERLSPLYRWLHSELFEYRADYRLTIQDEEGRIVCGQIFMDFPAAYEEVFRIADFSKDGNEDLAFCTGENFGTGSHNTHFRTFIWNGEKNCYEKRYPPKAEAYGRNFTGFPLWNKELQVLTAAVGTDEWDGAEYEMYSFEDGEWKRIRRLENAYSETEFYEMPREGKFYPATIGYWEFFYEDGEEISKNFEEFRIGTVFKNDSVWSSDNNENLKLYPDYPEWEKVSVIMDGIELEKEVKNPAYREPEAIYAYVENFDFSMREYPVCNGFYGSSLEQEYKEAFYEVIANRVPVRYEDDEAVYFRDILRGVSSMTDQEFVEDLENEKEKYRFIDCDGDGFPELAMNLDIDGVCIWKYLPEEKRVALYYGFSEGSRLLGSNRIGYYVPSGAGLTRYRYEVIGDEDTMMECIKFEAQYYEEEVTYTISVWGEDIEGSVSVDKEQWKKLTEPFLYVMNHPVTLLSFEEAFGKEFMGKQESDINPDEIENIYMDFLKGKRRAGNISIDTIRNAMEKPEEGENLQYLIYDTDTDGLPELHIRTGNTYYAMLYRNEKLFVWFTEDYEQNRCYEILESGELLYRNIQEGCEYYCCTKPEASSHREIIMDFKWEDVNGNEICDEDDLYQYNDAGAFDRYMGVAQNKTCSMEEWMEKTQKYLSIREDGRLEILNVMPWIVY